MGLRLTFSDSEPKTIVGLLQARAAEMGSKTAFIYLDGEDQNKTLTYAQLESRARNVGAWLSRQVNRGDRVLLAYPSGLEFVETFFGCLYAGCMPVPAYLPHPFLLKRSFPRLQAMIKDCRPALGLSTHASLQLLRSLASESREKKVFSWAATDESAQKASRGFEPFEAASDAPTMLQYSSGTSSSPRGIILTHGNLLCNARHICRLLHHTPDTTIVNWLPHSHDMGLVTTALVCLQTGGLGVLLSTLAFLKEPVVWLETLSRYKGASSPAPNFAYELCVRRSTPQQRARLDLSVWSAALNGAEPVRVETIERFYKCFRRNGFRRNAFYPCYGLAEATLMVTGGELLAGPMLMAVDRQAMEKGRVQQRAMKDNRASVLVGCGSPLPGHQVRIVDPKSRRSCAPGRIGEIWVSGPSVALGYWNRSKQTERTFRARLRGSSGDRFLRTGDLGFLHGGQLFVTGRLKDVIVIHGEKHYPEDIERTAQEASPFIRPSGCAAFSVPGEGGERLVVVVEADLRRGRRSARKSPARAPISVQIRSVVQNAVLRTHLIAAEICVVPPGALPKTTSGKVQRNACKSEFLTQKLKLLD